MNGLHKPEALIMFVFGVLPARGEVRSSRLIVMVAGKLF